MNLFTKFKGIIISIVLFGLICCSSKQKSFQEEYNGQWVEFWDSFDNKDKVTFDIIQTINENNMPLFEYHYKKESSVNESKFLIALKSEKSENWDYYIVWAASHKIEGPFKNDAGLKPPSLK